jgi:hypothetical protein
METKNKKPWFNIFNQTRNILENLEKIAENKSCVDVKKVKELRESIRWNNLPSVVDDSIELLGEHTNRNEKTLPRWAALPERLARLELKVNNIDCRAFNKVTEVAAEPTVNVSSINLVKYSKEGDLSGETVSTDIKVYFEDKSGDEVPNVGKKLFLKNNLTQPLEGYKGAFFFTKASDDSKEITIEVRGTGTVKRTKFEV